MICSKCGAPIPAGMTKCPYCGAENSAAGPRRGAEEETSFAAVDDGEFPAEDDVKTEFAGNAWAPAADDDEKTEFAPQGAAAPQMGFEIPASRPGQETPAKKAPKAKKLRNPKKRRNPKKPTGKADPTTCCASLCWRCWRY